MRLRWLAALAALVLAAAGCGGSGDSQGVASLEEATEDAAPSTTAAEVDREQAMLDYAQCMRDHGVDMEDPTVDENGDLRMARPSGSREGGAFDPAEREVMEAAREACATYFEGFAQQFEGRDLTEMQDLMLEYAACMRENGVDMEDPDFSAQGGGPGAGDRLQFGEGTLDPTDPVFQAANEVCQEIFGATGLPGFLGGSPGGGMGPGGGTPPDGSAPPDSGDGGGVETLP